MGSTSADTRNLPEISRFPASARAQRAGTSRLSSLRSGSPNLAARRDHPDARTSPSFAPRPRLWRCSSTPIARRAARPPRAEAPGRRTHIAQRQRARERLARPSPHVSRIPRAAPRLLRSSNAESTRPTTASRAYEPNVNRSPPACSCSPLALGTREIRRASHPREYRRPPGLPRQTPSRFRVRATPQTGPMDRLCPDPSAGCSPVPSTK